MTSDEDMKTFKTYTDHLESTDNQEVPGKVFVKDDIEQGSRGLVIISHGNTIGY